MKVIIQHCKTGFYLTNNFEWTRRIYDAWNVGSSVQAINVAMKFRLENVQIVLNFGSADLDVQLPLQASDCLEATSKA